MTTPLQRLQDMLDAALAAQPAPSRTDADLGPLDPRLHEYQRQAVAHLRSNPRAGLMLRLTCQTSW